MTDFLMPSLGADMESATVVEWHVAEGDQVAKGDIIAAVETEKGIIDIEVFEAGRIERIVVPVGAQADVDDVLAIYATENDEAAKIDKAVESKPLGKPHAAPGARRLAEQLHIDLHTVSGTGPQGSITLTDVQQLADLAQVTPDKPVQHTSKTTDTAREESMRDAIARAMQRSKREIPHYYLSSRIDCGRALEWLGAENAKHDVANRLLFPIVVLAAVASALKDHPGFNGYYLEHGFEASEDIHIGNVIALRRGGLCIPAIRNTDQHSLHELMDIYRDQVSRARTGRLSSQELSSSTVAVSNLGELGVDSVLPVIYPPQVAIFGFGTVIDQPWSVDGELQSRPVMTATLAADHRVSNGQGGAALLRSIDKYLQQPEVFK